MILIKRISTTLGIRPSDLLDPYNYEDSITRLAIDIVTLFSEERNLEPTETSNSDMDSLRARDLEHKKKYPISLEEAKRIVFGEKRRRAK